MCYTWLELSAGEMHCRSEQPSESTGPILLTSESDIVISLYDCARGANCIIAWLALRRSRKSRAVKSRCRALEVRERRCAQVVYTAITVLTLHRSILMPETAIVAQLVAKDKRQKANCCACFVSTVVERALPVIST